MEQLEGEAIPQRLDIDVVRTCLRPTVVRADDDSDGLGTLVGEFTVHGEWYEINSYWEGHFIERVRHGAGKRTINNRSNQSPVRVLLEHGFDPTVGDKPLGVPSVLEDRSSGVYAETPLLDTSYNRDLAPALRAGAYGQSFRFRVRADEWAEPDSEGWEDPGNPAWSELPQRTITEYQLEEFGPTVWPASPATNSSTGLRSATDQFYDQLERRDSARFESAVRSVRDARRPVAEPSADTTEDPQETHSDTPTAERGHVEDSPITHSEEPSTTPTVRKDGPVMEDMTIEEREARISEIVQRLNEIHTNSANSELRSADQEEWDNLVNERAAHEKAITESRKRQDLLRSLVDNDDAHEDGDTTEQRSAAAARQAPGVVVKPDNIYDVHATRSRARSAEEAHRLYRDNAKRAIDAATFPGAEDRAKAQHAAMRLLDKLDDEDSTYALRLLKTGSPVYDRAFGKAVLASNTGGLSPDEQRALSLGVDGSGGYAVPFQLDPTVMLTSDGVINPLRSIARVEQITGKEWQGVTSAGITVTRKAEAAQADDNSPTLGQPTVGTSRVDGFVPFSYELERTWSQLREELTSLLADAKATEEADSFINGDGTGVNPEGLLTAAIPTVATASGTALTRQDLYKVKNALPPRFRARAQWLAETSFYDQVRELSADSDIWAELAGDINPRLLNKPTNEASEMPAYEGTINSVDAVFGDFRNFLIVDRVGMNVELVPQVFGAAGRPTGQRGIFAIWFNGCKVLIPVAFRKLVQAGV